MKKFHEDAVLTLFSTQGAQGSEIISGGADEEIRVWKLKKKKLQSCIHVKHPSEKDLYDWMEAHGGESKLKNYAENHPINTVREK